MKTFPRFLPRGLLKQCNNEKYNSNSNSNSNIKVHLKSITNKNVLLDYSQARIALLHLLKYSVKPSSYILTTSYTIYDMVNVIINAGHIPYFVDIDRNHLCPNINQIKYLIKSKKVNCVIYTHLHGYNIDLEDLSKLCKDYNCFLIEDCAQSLWCDKWSKTNRSPGYYSDAAIYSTGFYKNINTISGGFLLLNKGEPNTDRIISMHCELSSSITKDFLIRLLNALIFYIAVNKIIFPLFTFPLLKFARKYRIKFITNKAREEVRPRYINRTSKDIKKMNIIQNHLIRYKNNISLEEDFKKKLKIARIYLDNLSDLNKESQGYIPGTHILNNKLEFYIETSFNQIPFVTNKPVELINHLQNKGFDIAIQNLLDLNSLKIYSHYKKTELSVVKELSKKVLLFPCYPECSIIYISKMVNEINMFFYNK